MKIAGSYASLLRGVSQQPPEVRQPGQHSEQVNMLSDPVAGLTRRQGSVMQRAERASPGPLTPLQTLDRLATANSYRTIEYTSGGSEYLILVRGTANAKSLAESLPPLIAYDITGGTFCPVEYVGGQAGDQGASLNANGVSAITTIGEYLVYAQNNRTIDIGTVAPWPSNKQVNTTVWIRGGAYDRAYRVNLPGGAFAQFATPSAGTTGAAAAIAPANIAAQIVTQLGTLGYTCAISGSHFLINGHPTITVTDGGDGSLMRGNNGDIEDISKLNLMAQHGDVVRVGAGGGSAGFYLKAEVKTGGFGEAIWRETSGDNRPGSAIHNFGIIKVKDGIMYVGMYDGVSPGGGLTGALLIPNVPEFVGSSAGDEVSNPSPKWMRGQITYLGTFQDRLLVGCGGALSVSAAGDYFNFFRSTVTTVPLKDAFEMTPQGGEDDILRHSVPYSKNLVIFGDKKQYVISGSQALTPTSANMQIMTVYADAAVCPPLAAGGQIYYARNRDGSVALHQIQPGTFVDSAESFPASAQIGTYIPAPGAEIKAVPGSPAQLILRSRSRPRSLYVFTYLDQPDGRKQEAWSRWEYNEKCGELLGMHAIPAGLLLLWARPGSDGYMYFVADLQPLAPELSARPYLDSARLREPYLAQHASLQDIKEDNPAGWSAAFGNQTTRFLIGGDLSEAAALATSYPASAASLYVGLEYDSYVIPTNPFLKDPQEKAILSGRSVITRLILALRKTAGLTATLTAGGADTVYTFNGRVLGDPANLIGRIAVSDSEQGVSIGREVREYVIKLAAQRWYPLTITGIEWLGQAFNRTKRA